jgi:hypothetical protein
LNRRTAIHLNLNQGPPANFFEHPAHDITPNPQPILVKADQVVDALGLDDEGLEGLLSG